MRRIFVLEGLLIWIAGALLGWMLGEALTRLLGTIEFKSVELPILRDFHSRTLLATICAGIDKAQMLITRSTIPRISSRRYTKWHAGVDIDQALCL